MEAVHVFDLRKVWMPAGAGMTVESGRDLLLPTVMLDGRRPAIVGMTRLAGCGCNSLRKCSLLSPSVIPAEAGIQTVSASGWWK